MKIRDKAKKAVIVFAAILLVSMYVPRALVAQEALVPGWQGLIYVVRDMASLFEQFEARISGFAIAFGQQLSRNYEQMVDQIKVATMQESISQWEVSEAIIKSGRTLVTALQQQELADDLVSAAANVHPDTGQGYNPCSTVFRLKSMDLSFDVARQQAQQSIPALESGPGRLVESKIQSARKRLDEHLRDFCSPDEEAAGQCTASELPGGDLNAALLFEAADAESLKARARKAYIAHVLGEPDQKIAKSVGSTVQGEQMFVDKSRKDALTSVPAYSLSYIDESNTKRTEFNDLSANELMKQRVDQYFGGEEATAWASSMARQTQRGLLVEANRIAGLENWMLHKDYQRTQRMEANLAALAIVLLEQGKGRAESGGSQSKIDARAREVKK